MANNTVAKAPTAADSVGVPQPPTIAPTTTPKIETKGRTYMRKGLKRSKPRYSMSAELGARAGFIRTRTMM